MPSSLSLRAQADPGGAFPGLGSLLPGPVGLNLNMASCIRRPPGGSGRLPAACALWLGVSFGPAPAFRGGPLAFPQLTVEGPEIQSK